MGSQCAIAAAEALKQLPRKDYVPLLLACAQFPAEFACSLLVSGGIVHAEYTVDLQGLDADVSFQHADSMQRVANIFPAYDVTILRSRDNPEIDGTMISTPVPEPPGNPAMFAGAAVGKAPAIKAQAEQYNAAADAINRRVVETLARATGQKNWMPIHGLGSRGGKSTCATTTRWSRCQQTGNARAGPQGGRQGGQVRQSTGKGPSSSIARGSTSCLPVGTASCKPRGFPVLTARHRCGRRPVPDRYKEIQPGDRVLAQDATTGELAYKAVENIATRQPTPLIRVTVSGEEILATRRQQCNLVMAVRRVMAKYFRRGICCTPCLDRCRWSGWTKSPAPEAWYEFTYNLQVEGFHTYFVGENQMLVHHLSMLSILDEGSSIVPGL